MAWGWSHTNEACRDCRDNLALMPRDWLNVVYAEWRAAEVRGRRPEDGRFEAAFDSRRYAEWLYWCQTAPNLDDDALADAIWDWMETAALCTNGGHNAYGCPHGCPCHYVSFSPAEVQDFAHA
jgi:hypothetical protein